MSRFSGWGSQVIFIVPDLDLVVVTTADNFDYGGPDVDALLVTRILPELSLQLDSRFSGSWYDPEMDGQGFSMEVLTDSNTVVAYWYTYTTAGPNSVRKGRNNQWRQSEEAPHHVF